ncbi:MAG: hypothetical protein AAFU64_04530, partial [Bacteroidota bacterium]
YLERKNGSQLLLIRKSKMRKSTLQKLSKWLTYIPLPIYCYCPSATLRERYRTELERIPQMQVGTDQPVQRNYSLRFPKGNQYQLPRSRRIKERQRWFSEKEPNLDIWFWSRRSEIPAYIMAIACVSLFAFVFLKLAIHEKNSIPLWVGQGLFDVLLVGLLYSAARLLVTYHLLSFNQLELRYAEVHSPKGTIPLDKALAYTQIFRLEGSLNGEKYCLLKNRNQTAKGGELLMEKKVSQWLRSLNLRRLLSNFNLVKNDLQEAKDGTQEIFGSLTQSQSGILNIPMEYLGIGERLYFEDKLSQRLLLSST